MKTTIECEFNLGQTVLVKALKIDGTVTGIMKESDGVTYRVAYWWDGCRKSEWLFINEIEPKR